MKKKILVKGPAMSRSGYGEQTRFALRALKQKQDIFDIFLININWGHTGYLAEDNEERRWIDNLLKKTIFHHQNGGGYDISLQVTIPNEFEKIAPINIGAISFGFFVWSRQKMDDRLKRHETIHFQQQIELLFVFQWLLYIIFWLFNVVKYRNGSVAYRQIPFEREA